MLQQIQDSANICACLRRLCGRRRDNAEADNTLDQTDILDETQAMEDYQPKGPMKKRVVPNSNQDKWLYYLLTNLNKMNEDSDWV